MGGVLLRLLRLADGTDASNSIFAEICTVAVLSGLVCDALVDSVIDPSVSNLPSKYLSNLTYLFNCRRCERFLLAGGGIGAPGHGNRVLRGLLLVASFLGGHSNATVLGRLNTNGLQLRVSFAIGYM